MIKLNFLQRLGSKCAGLEIKDDTKAYRRKNVKLYNPVSILIQEFMPNLRTGFRKL